MISRRSLLATGATVAGAAVLLGTARATHRLDDLADAVGLEPRPEPVPSDDRLVRRAARDQAALLALLGATADRHPRLRHARLERIGRQHLDALGGAPDPDVAAVPGSADAAAVALRKAYVKASDDRAADAVRAVSPALARVLASMSAGLAQCAQELA